MPHDSLSSNLFTASIIQRSSAKSSLMIRPTNQWHHHAHGIFDDSINSLSLNFFRILFFSLIFAGTHCVWASLSLLWQDSEKLKTAKCHWIHRTNHSAHLVLLCPHECVMYVTNKNWLYNIGERPAAASQMISLKTYAMPGDLSLTIISSLRVDFEVKCRNFFRVARTSGFVFCRLSCVHC